MLNNRKNFPLSSLFYVCPLPEGHSSNLILIQHKILMSCFIDVSKGYQRERGIKVIDKENPL